MSEEDCIKCWLNPCACGYKDKFGIDLACNEFRSYDSYLKNAYDKGK